MNEKRIWEEVEKCNFFLYFFQLNSATAPAKTFKQERSMNSRYFVISCVSKLVHANIIVYRSSTLITDFWNITFLNSNETAKTHFATSSKNFIIRVKSTQNIKIWCKNLWCCLAFEFIYHLYPQPFLLWARVSGWRLRLFLFLCCLLVLICWLSWFEVVATWSSRAGFRGNLL